MSASEAYLTKLAERAFLKPWAIANPFRRRGKELSDLIVPFGEDIIVFSDKAIVFAADRDPDLAWSRWERDAIQGAVKQLRGAARTLERPDCTIFTDHLASRPLAFTVPPPGKRRYHLVAVVRPSRDPQHLPPNWSGLIYTDRGAPGPFQVGPISVGPWFVHVFDGASLDLILSQLDTAPDLIAYLSSRAAALSARPGLAFSERDLLALAIENWMNRGAFEVSLSTGDAADLPGRWDRYVVAGRAARTRKVAKDSYVLDRLVSEFHREHLERRAANPGSVDPDNHEQAMRLVAMESRFARRMIAASLTSILKETDRKRFWAATVPSPTSPGVRYLWLAYPKAPPGLLQAVVDADLHNRLRAHLIVAADAFQDDHTLVGFAVPNLATNDTLIIMQVLNAEVRTNRMRQEAAYWREQGILRNLEPEHWLHVP